MKKLLVAGWDGYIGYALVQRLLNNGYEVIGIDNFWRRDWIKEMKSISAIPIKTWFRRYNHLKYLGKFTHYNIDISQDYEKLKNCISKYYPDTIINLAHNGSAPYSQINREKAERVLLNNIMGTNNFMWIIKEVNPNIHYITIGSTGEYSHYSNIDIEEGYFEIEHKGRRSSEMIYPRRPGSIYHASKVSSTYLIDFLSRTWNLKCTDIMQSVVFGMYTPEIDLWKNYTRLDTDEAGGTVINRFVVQMILNEPLTIFGRGDHQRGFLTLNDSIQALEIAIDNPPKSGTPRVWNQLSFWKSINKLADKIIEIGKEFGFKGKKVHIETPRNERTEEHYYKYITKILASLGYEPTRTLTDEIFYMFKVLLDTDLSSKEKEILKSNIKPRIKF